MAKQTHLSPARWHAHALRLAAALALLLAFILPVPAAHAATLDACPTGSSYPTIQAAIDAAAPGDTIHVCAATFLENITVTKDLTLLGASQDGTIVDGGARGSVVTVPPGVTAAISHLTLTNGRVEPSDAVRLGQRRRRPQRGQPHPGRHQRQQQRRLHGWRHRQRARRPDDPQQHCDRQPGRNGCGYSSTTAPRKARPRCSSARPTSSTTSPPSISLNGPMTTPVPAAASTTATTASCASSRATSTATSPSALAAASRTAKARASTRSCGSPLRSSAATTPSAAAASAPTPRRTSPRTSISGNQARGASADQADGLGGGIRSTGTLRVANSTVSGNYASGLSAARQGLAVASTPTTGAMPNIPTLTS